MADTFPELIGKIIHHCGALELLTNNAIRALGTDSLLSSEVAKSPFRRRIDVLRRLLEDRTQLPSSEIKVVVRRPVRDSRESEYYCPQSDSQ